MRSYEQFSHTGEAFDVLINIEEPSKGELAATIEFRKGKRAGTTGFGGGASIPVFEGWAVQFLDPNELWIYDGKALFILHERTATGFKASSSDKVPELKKRAPKALSRQVARR